MSYRAPFFWAKLPFEYKNSTSLSHFKTKIKNWKGDQICPCRLCKVYLPNTEYMSDITEAWKVPCSYKNLTQVNNNKKKIYATLYMQLLEQTGKTQCT